MTADFVWNLLGPARGVLSQIRSACGHNVLSFIRSPFGSTTQCSRQTYYSNSATPPSKDKNWDGLSSCSMARGLSNTSEYC